MMKKKGNVISKLVLYILISCITAYIGEFNAMTLTEVQDLDPFQWVTKLISIILPGLITWRAFIDQSITTFNLDDYKDNI